jgi:hypothetical protein
VASVTEHAKNILLTNLDCVISLERWPMKGHCFDITPHGPTQAAEISCARIAMG